MLNVLKQALERLNKAIDEPNNTMSDGKALKEILRQIKLAREDLSKAIADLEKQETVAWIDDRCLKDINNFDATVYANGGFDCAVPLYTSPPQRKPLTDEQKLRLCKQFPDHLTFNAIHAIEAAHVIGEKK